ncbi:MAG: phage baseplate assembly protein V [Rikenellaceae bacterium]
MYYKISILKEYEDDNSNKFVLNLTTPVDDANDAVFRELTNSETSGRSIEDGVYTLSSIRVQKQLESPNYIAAELSISDVSFTSIAKLKDNLRQRFVDAEVSLSLIYGTSYQDKSDLALALKHRVVNFSLSNISSVADSVATVNVKLDIYSPDQYATLNIHSQVFTGKQFGEIMTDCFTRFTYLLGTFKESKCIEKSYNLYYKYSTVDETKTKYEKISDSAADKAGNITSTYKVEETLTNYVIPHVIPYSVQYNESTYDFMRRLCRRYGETLYFEDGFLNVGIHPKFNAAVSLYGALSNISFNEQTDSQSSLYVGGNYITDSTNSFLQSGSSTTTATTTVANAINTAADNTSNVTADAAADAAADTSGTVTASDYSVVNQEAAVDENHIDIFSSIDKSWAEDNPRLDDYYLDYLGETSENKDKIPQEDRYEIVDNSIVYLPAIAVRLVYQILTFKLTEPDKYSDFILENAMSIFESYRLVGEINEGHNEHVETTSYTSRLHYKNNSNVTYTEDWVKSSSNKDAKEKGTKVANSQSPKVESNIGESTGQDKVVDNKEATKKLISGVRYVDSPRGLAEVMYKSSLALTSFIVKSSAESNRNRIKVTLVGGDNVGASYLSNIIKLRLGSVVTLDKIDEDSSNVTRYVVSGINVYTDEDTTTPIVEVDLIQSLAVTYSNILGEAPTTNTSMLEFAFPYFTADDMIRRAEPQRAYVVDVSDSYKLNRARVCYPWQYAFAGDDPDPDDASNVTEISDTTTVNSVQRKTELAKNLKKGASPWLRVSTPANKGGGKGFVFSPALHSEVIVSYESGNIERPYISGSMFTGPGTAFMGQQVADVSSISTQYGRKIMLCDTAVGGGSSFLTSIFPFTSLLGIDASGLVDEALDGYIQIGDQYGLCSLNMSSTTRAISISTPAGKVNISALTGINIVAPSGDITISGKNVNIMAENNLNLMSGTRVGRMRKASMEYSGKSIKGKIAAAGMSALTGAFEWAIGELIDLSLVRTLFECFFAPVGGTMVIKSHRYLCIEGGAGRTKMPDSTNNKCYISEVLSGFMKVLAPFDGWRSVRYQSCYDKLLPELVGTAANDNNCLLFKFFGDANGTLNATGTDLRTYLTDRIVAPSSFPPMNGQNPKTFVAEGNDGFGQYLTDTRTPPPVNNVPQAQINNYVGNHDPLNKAELRSKIELAMAAYNDYKDFFNENSQKWFTDTREATTFIGSRLKAIPEKSYGVSNNGIKNLITAKLFGGLTPTLSEIKAGNVNGNGTLLRQIIFGTKNESMAAKRITLLILMRMITTDILKKYGVNVNNVNGGISAVMIFGDRFELANPQNPQHVDNIRVLLNTYVADTASNIVAQGVNICTISGLYPNAVVTVNRDWGNLCNGFSLGIEMNLESTEMQYGVKLLETLDSASGLQLQKTATDSWFSLPKIRTDRRKDDTGAILFSVSPAATAKFNPQTAMLEMVQTTENPVDAAFKAAMLSI